MFTRGKTEAELLEGKMRQSLRDIAAHGKGLVRGTATFAQLAKEFKQKFPEQAAEAGKRICESSRKAMMQVADLMESSERLMQEMPEEFLAEWPDGGGKDEEG